jgi:excisionase family DNA binding protein
MTPEYLTIKDVAAMMLVTPRTVWRWIRIGRIRPVRVGGEGGGVRFNKSKLLRQIEAYENEKFNPPDSPELG